MRISEKFRNNYTTNKYNNDNSDNPLTSRRTDGGKKDFTILCGSRVQNLALLCIPPGSSTTFSRKGHKTGQKLPLDTSAGFVKSKNAQGTMIYRDMQDNRRSTKTVPKSGKIRPSFFSS